MLKYKEFVNWLNEADLGSAEFDKGGGKYRKMLLDKLDSEGDLMIGPKYHKYVGSSSIAIGTIENIDYIKDYLKTDKVISAKGPHMIIGDKKIPLTYILKTGQFSHPPKTDTDIKESMVVYYYYNPNIDILADTEAAAKACENIPSNALHPNTREKLESWILETDDSFMDKLSQWKSCADILPSGLFLDRGQYYNEIKNIGRKLSGMGSADNWCPGDIYLYNEADMAEIFEHAKTSTDIAQLNAIFSNKLEPNTKTFHGAVTAISLKEEVARSGKAKGYMKNISPKDTVYNLTTAEMDLCKNDREKSILLIKQWQDKIESVLSSSGLNTTYVRHNPDELKPDQIAPKLGSIKLSYYLLTLPKNSSDEADSNLLGIYKFGMKQGLPDVNPPYYKVTGKTSGKATVELITAGDTITLEFGGMDSSETKLVVVDKNTRRDLLFYYYVSKGDSIYEVTLVIGGGGGKQQKMEFFTPELIANPKDDPASIKKVESLYLRRAKGNI